MRKQIIRRAQTGLVRHLRSRYTMERAVPTQGMFNLRCHENCVEWLRTHPGERLEIVEAVCVDDGEPILHYCVREVETGRLLEVTLGWRATEIEYYMIRTIHVDDRRHIHSEFNRSMTDWTQQFVSPVWRWLLRIDRVL